jgi:hypothetical protein
MELLSLETGKIIRREVMVDTGADVSIMKTWFAKRLGLNFVSSPHETFADYKGQIIGSQFCLTEPLFVFNGGHMTPILFRVIDSDEKFDSEAILLGSPDMQKLGIGLHGVQVAYPSVLSALVCQDPEPWSRARVELSTPPDVILSEHDMEFIKSDKVQLLKLLDENNQKVPPNSHTSHPNKIFTIELMEGSESKLQFQKPYTYDADSQAALNVQMNKWLELGFVKQFVPTDECPKPPCC